VKFSTCLLVIVCGSKCIKDAKGEDPIYTWRLGLFCFVLYYWRDFQGKALNSIKAFPLTSCYFRSDIPTKQSLCGKLQSSKSKPNALLLLCDKRRLKLGTILGSYFFFIGVYGPSIWLIFSDDSLKIEVLILAKWTSPYLLFIKEGRLFVRLRSLKPPTLPCALGVIGKPWMSKRAPRV
jgi:hypothetical protein